MKLNLLSVAAACGLTLISTNTASAYLADGRTIISDPNATEARLYSTTSVLAPVQSVIWFVADTLNNGINLAPADGASVLAVDDILIRADNVDGSLFGTNPGKYIRGGIAVDDSFAAVPIYFYLWNTLSASPDTFVPQNGDTFGTYSLGVVPPPQVGNAFWGIDGNVFGDTYIVGVPEPSTYLLSGLGLLGLAAYRRFKN
jgi:hypothetical protein